MDPLSIGLMVGSTVLSASSALEQGDQAERDAKQDAYELEQAGTAAYADSTRRSYEAAREGKIVASNARAAQAASGGVTTDAGATDQLAEIERDAQYNSMSALFEGKSKREDYLRQAARRRIEGKEAKEASRMEAITTVLSGGSQIFGAYRKQNPKLPKPSNKPRKSGFASRAYRAYS